MPSPENTRIAVLIDSDNISSTHVDALMEEVATYGTPTVRRAYGDWTSDRLKGWKSNLNRQAIQPIQQFAYTSGKNSTDFALVIDAMDLLYSGNLEAFAIVSGDSDFTRLMTRLRESGKTVYGFGRENTPEATQNACDKFVYLEVLTKEKTGAQPSGLPALRPMLEAAIEAASGEDHWANLGGLGSVLNARHPSFDSRNYGYQKLSELVRAQDYLDVDPTGSTVKVRLSKYRPAKKAAAKKAAKKS